MWVTRASPQFSTPLLEWRHPFFGGYTSPFILSSHLDNICHDLFLHGLVSSDIDTSTEREACCSIDHSLEKTEATEFEQSFTSVWASQMRIYTRWPLGLR